MRKVKFHKFGANAAFGSFQPGQQTVVNDEFARHLVEEADVAEYIDSPTAEDPAPVEAAAPAPKRKAKAAQ